MKAQSLCLNTCSPPDSQVALSLSVCVCVCVCVCVRAHACVCISYLSFSKLHYTKGLSKLLATERNTYLIMSSDLFLIGDHVVLKG